MTAIRSRATTLVLTGGRCGKNTATEKALPALGSEAPVQQVLLLVDEHPEKFA